MARLVALLVLVVALCTVSAYSSKAHSCGPHEEWVECGQPTACDATCDQPPPPACTENCVERCQCQKGYLKNNLNLCVLSQNC